MPRSCRLSQSCSFTCTQEAGFEKGKPVLLSCSPMPASFTRAISHALALVYVACKQGGSGQASKVPAERQHVQELKHNMVQLNQMLMTRRYMLMPYTCSCTHLMLMLYTCSISLSCRHKILGYTLHLRRSYAHAGAQRSSGNVILGCSLVISSGRVVT